MLKIGLSACFFHADPQRPVFKGKTLLYLEQACSHWVMSEGALTFLIPQPAQGSPVSLRDHVRELDGLVLEGGSDVCPRSYGESPLKPEWNGDFVRDGYEIELIREFLAQKKPVLGICRGAQIMNVAFGGTLYQDIATQVAGSRNHRDWNIYDRNFHELAIEGGSMLSRWYPGVTRGKINTVHHQAVKDLGKELVVEARCIEDGIVEAIRHAREPFCYGVQWHPEWQDSTDPTLFDGKPILKEFLKAASERK